MMILSEFLALLSYGLKYGMIKLGHDVMMMIRDLNGLVESTISESTVSSMSIAMSMTISMAVGWGVGSLVVVLVMMWAILMNAEVVVVVGLVGVDLGNSPMATVWSPSCSYKSVPNSIVGVSRIANGDQGSQNNQFEHFDDELLGSFVQKS